MLRSHLLSKCLGLSLTAPVVLEIRFRKALVPQARVNSPLETLEGQPTACRQELVSLPCLLRISITFHLPRKLLCRIASLVKPSMRLAMKKIRMDVMRWLKGQILFEGQRPVDQRFGFRAPASQRA